MGNELTAAVLTLLLGLSWVMATNQWRRSHPGSRLAIWSFPRLLVREAPGRQMLRQSRPESLWQQDRQAASQWATELLERSDWVVLDTETTGLDSRAEVVQVAVLDPHGRPLLNTLVRPTTPIPLDVVRIHGITDLLVAAAPTFADIHPQLADVLQGKTVICYNADFDRRMLRQSGRRHGLPEIPAAWDCAMEQYARYCGQWMSLKGAYAYQKLPRRRGYAGQPHQAFQDCVETLAVIRAMAQG